MVQQERRQGTHCYCLRAPIDDIFQEGENSSHPTWCAVTKVEQLLGGCECNVQLAFLPRPALS